MKVKMHVKQVNTGAVWAEEYDIKNNENPGEYARKLVEKFNNTLRPNESPRELVGVEVLEEDSDVVIKHGWEKQNAVTIMRGNRSYDAYKCSICGVTGKRYGLSAVMVRDSAFKGKVYETCSTAMAQMRKNKERMEADDPCQPCHNSLQCLVWAEDGIKAKCNHAGYFKKHYASGDKKIIGAELLQDGDER